SAASSPPSCCWARFTTANAWAGATSCWRTAGTRWPRRPRRPRSVEARVALATAYCLGRGKPKDPAQAVHSYREAAKPGDVGAQHVLASMYERGDGVDADLPLARYWYDIAAHNGDEAAPGKVKEIDARLAVRPG
ncbi:MAG: tetratricopeptide repeat protein, partial [Rubrivivax sp.]|nr:tetratricopeptide repeat protein [Rubrivivax sp.]